MIDRIKEFFRNLFSSSGKRYLEAPKEMPEAINNIEEQTNEDFKSQMFVNNEENERILKLQKDFKAGLIKEWDLSDEDFDALYSLYESQIENTKKSIQNYKDKIINIRTKLAESN